MDADNQTPAAWNYLRTETNFTENERKKLREEVKLREQILRAIRSDNRKDRLIDPGVQNDRQERLTDLTSQIARRRQFLENQFRTAYEPGLAFTRTIQPDHEFRVRRYMYGN